MKSGKFIVIDGIDGAGKETQIKLLKNRLTKEGLQCKYADFPQYGEKSAGAVEEYLNGKYGSADEVGPYAAAILFAVDRYAARSRIRNWLKEGFHVISNRYVTANMGHQGGLIANKRERLRFYAWLDGLEHGIFDLPRPDVNIILTVKPSIAAGLIEKRGKKPYLTGNSTKDILAGDLKHLIKAERTFREISGLRDNFRVIECDNGREILSRQDIHALIWKNLKPILK